LAAGQARAIGRVACDQVEHDVLLARRDGIWREGSPVGFLLIA
jgi:hypothetical protein